MKLKIAGRLAAAGAVLATVLRFIQMTFFFDYQTGFSTDSGILTLAFCLVAGVAAVAAGLLCFFDRSLRGTAAQKSSPPVAMTAFLSAVFLIICGAVFLFDFVLWKKSGVTSVVPPAHVAAHLPFAVLSLLFGAVQLAAAVAWLRGRWSAVWLGATRIVPVLWGLFFMVLTFMVYSASATTAENLFTVGGSAALLLFLLNEGKLYAGLGGGKTVRNLYVFGLPALLLWVVYVLSNSVLMIAGRGYNSEIPYAMQLAMLMLTVYIGTMLGTIHRVNSVPAASMPDSSHSEKE